MNQNFWCIVTYLGSAPMYYQGYYGLNQGDDKLKPAIGFSFDDALKLHSKAAAESLLSKLPVSDWKVEDHQYFQISDHKDDA